MSWQRGFLPTSAFQSSSNCSGRELWGCCGIKRGSFVVNDGVQSTLCLMPKSKTDLKLPSSGEVKDVGSGKFTSY